MPAAVNIHEAKTHLSRLLVRVEAGEEIVIQRGGRPVAKIVPLDAPKPRTLGRDRGLFQVPADFNDPLPDELQAAFEGRL